MTDMLVKLYALPEVIPLLNALKQNGLEIRRPHPSEKYVLAEWVRQHFKESWAVGCNVALEHKPVSCYITVEKSQAHIPSDSPYDLPDEVLVGFACYDVASKGMFGAMGVKEDYQRQGIGTALLLTCLHAMKEEGYAYAILGWVASVDFYARAAGATVIPNSEPGIFRGKLVAQILQAKMVPNTVCTRPPTNYAEVVIERMLPSQIFVVQYAPEHLYFLESAFESKLKSQSQFLVNRSKKVIELAYEEFKAESNEWVWL